MAEHMHGQSELELAWDLNEHVQDAAFTLSNGLEGIHGELAAIRSVLQRLADTLERLERRYEP